MSGDLTNWHSSMIIKTLALVLLLFSIVSCNNDSGSKITVSKPGGDDMIELNRYLVQKDRERIQNYIERKNLNMTESPTGLWFQILNEGAGKNFTDNDKITMDYECSLLDGTKCYSSKTLGPKVVVLGKSSMEPGLNEALRMLKPGADAIFIIPPFLAYGLVGDGNKIPSRSVIVYNINILQPR